jgi:hypothetical protein
MKEKVTLECRAGTRQSNVGHTDRIGADRVDRRVKEPLRLHQGDRLSSPEQCLTYISRSTSGATRQLPIDQPAAVYLPPCRSVGPGQFKVRVSVPTSSVVL